MRWRLRVTFPERGMASADTDVGGRDERPPASSAERILASLIERLPAVPIERLPAGYPEFPGCRPVHISRRDIKTCETRVEYWDAASEIAMVRNPVPNMMLILDEVREPLYMEHDAEAARLAQRVALIAQERGSDIYPLGGTNLLLRGSRGSRGEWGGLMQGDQILFLERRDVLLTGGSVEVGRGEFPDVVMEVDNTTDVRRGKLGVYESWGFPELWVEVPELAAPSRPKSLRPGLTIYLREEGAFRIAPASRAFPGWTAEEIHKGLNDVSMSGATVAALRRVGRAMGEAEGTGPDDHPFMREMRRTSRVRGHAEGRAEGHAEMLHANVRQVLEARGLAFTPLIARRLKEVDAALAPEALQAVLACRSEDEFLSLLSEVEQ